MNAHLRSTMYLMNRDEPCSIRGVYPLVRIGSTSRGERLSPSPRRGGTPLRCSGGHRIRGWSGFSPPHRALFPCLPWMDTQDTTELITIHQIHRQSHMNAHQDSSICSALGVYPPRTGERASTSSRRGQKSRASAQRRSEAAELQNYSTCSGGSRHKMHPTRRADAAARAKKRESLRAQLGPAADTNGQRGLIGRHLRIQDARSSSDRRPEDHKVMGRNGSPYEVDDAFDES